ncbi:MAG TPA: CvpA family protein [Flavisolibacter sp.]|nr:CvpA family protein [Flavisolibacter sp.]
MFLDIIVLLLLVLALFKGLRKGFIIGIFSFLAFIIGLAAALKLSSLAAGYIGQNTGVSGRWLPVIAFVLVFVGVAFLIHLGAKALEGVVRLALLGWLNKIGGVILFSLLYLFILSILLFYAEQLHLIGTPTTGASITYPLLHHLGPEVIDGLAVVLPLFRNMFESLGNFFEGVAAKE